MDVLTSSILEHGFEFGHTASMKAQSTDLLSKHKTGGMFIVKSEEKILEKKKVFVESTGIGPKWLLTKTPTIIACDVGVHTVTTWQERQREVLSEMPIISHVRIIEIPFIGRRRKKLALEPLLQSQPFERKR